ncbi:MAG: hypothetical protein PHD04_00820 [Candidatus Pacebacteria bacterium]|nr:hypothetical protein [Candidatus Paceibacterota bacterium]
MKKYIIILLILFNTSLWAGAPSPIPQNIPGNAATATALQANGANCSSGNAPLGVDASGAAEGCFAVQTYNANLQLYTETPTAGGTADALTATYTTASTLTDGLRVRVIAAAANATTTPTFTPTFNGVAATAHTITKVGNVALVAGDIKGAGHVLDLQYNLAGTRWEFINAGGGTPIILATTFIDAGGMVPDTSSGLLQMKKTNNQFDYLEFAQTVVQYATFRWVPPSDWDLGTIKAKFHWISTATTTGTPNAAWGLACWSAGDGITLDKALTVGAVTITDAYVSGDETNPMQKITAATAAITVDGVLGAGYPIYCRVSGDATAGAAGWKIGLIGIQIQYGLTGTGPVAW